MVVEVLKEYKTEKRWRQEKEMVDEAGIPELLRGITKKNKDVIIDEAPDDIPRYYLDVWWNFKDGDPQNFITVVANYQKNTLTISGSSGQEVEEEEWRNKKFLKKVLKTAYKNPGTLLVEGGLDET